MKTHRLIYYPELQLLIEVHANFVRSTLREKCSWKEALALSVDMELDLYEDNENGTPERKIN